jgi:hypothetical protein
MNVDHFNVDVGPTDLCKVLILPKFDLLSIFNSFCEDMRTIPPEIILRTITGCRWKVKL